MNIFLSWEMFFSYISNIFNYIRYPIIITVALIILLD
jgi:hypothetical protein